MNYSAFFVLGVTLISVVCAQQQSIDTAENTYRVINESSQKNLDAGIFKNATLVLKDDFTRGTKIVEQSQKTLNESISAAEKAIANPEAAREIMNKAFGLVYKQFAEAIPIYFRSFGEALDLSNDGAEQGLRNASVLLQKAGLSLFNQLEIAQNVINFGINVTDFAAELLFQAVRLTVETGYTGFYDNAQKSIKTANMALKVADAKAKGLIGFLFPPRGERNTNCDAAKNDAQGGSDAVKQINQAATNALARGANRKQVEEYKKKIICALGDIIVVTKEGGSTVHSLLPLAESDPEAAEKKYFTVIKKVKEVTIAAAAKMFVAIGDVASESGKETSTEIQEAIVKLEQGKVELIKAVEAGGGVLVAGLRYKGDTPSQTIDAVARIGYYAKLAILQGIVKSVKLVLSVI